MRVTRNARRGYQTFTCFYTQQRPTDEHLSSRASQCRPPNSRWRSRISDSASPRRPCCRSGNGFGRSCTMCRTYRRSSCTYASAASLVSYTPCTIRSQPWSFLPGGSGPLGPRVMDATSMKPAGTKAHHCCDATELSGARGTLCAADAKSPAPHLTSGRAQRGAREKRILPPQVRKSQIRCRCMRAARRPKPPFPVHAPACTILRESPFPAARSIASCV